MGVYDPEWMNEAVCRTDTGDYTDLMYPTEGDDDAIALAKSFCAICPSQGDCLEYAIAHRESYGVWGGTTEVERRRLIRRMRSHPVVENQLTLALT